MIIGFIFERKKPLQKTTFLYLFVLFFLLMLVGCQKKADQVQKMNQKTIGIVYDLGGLGDKSFNDGVARGAEKAKKNFGVKVLGVESKTANDFETNIRSLVEQDVDLIINVGSMQKNALQKMAKEHPKQKFLLVDTYLDAENVRSLTFKEHEGSFLAGYLAGLMSNKIGFIAGMKLPVIMKFYTGYVAGAKTANKNIEVISPKFLGGWSDINGGKVAADILYNQGADVIYQVASRAGLGVLKSAQENGKYAIGVDSDQDHLYPGAVLTSMIKNADQAVFSSIKDLIEGQFDFGQKHFGLKEEGVGLSKMLYTKKVIGPVKLTKINDIRQQILQGKITVPSNEVELSNYLSEL